MTTTGLRFFFSDFAALTGITVVVVVAAAVLVTAAVVVAAAVVVVVAVVAVVVVVVVVEPSAFAFPSVLVTDSASLLQGFGVVGATVRLC